MGRGRLFLGFLSYIHTLTQINFQDLYLLQATVEPDLKSINMHKGIMRLKTINRGKRNQRGKNTCPKSGWGFSHRKACVCVAVPPACWH